LAALRLAEAELVPADVEVVIPLLSERTVPPRGRTANLSAVNL
jgi:hypothetical protein